VFKINFPPMSQAIERIIDPRQERVGHIDISSIWIPRIDSTLGVYRVSIDIVGDEGMTKRTAVLKVLDSSPRSQREVTLSTGTVLLNLPHSITTPRCLGTVTIESTTGILYEDVNDILGGEWPPKMFIHVARLLGRLSGGASSRLRAAASSVPARQLLTRDQVYTDTLDALEKWGDHRFIRLLLPTDLRSALLSLMQHRERVVTMLEGELLLVCHGDAQRRNAFAISQDAISLIDWPNLSMAPPAVDLATLVYYGFAHFDMSIADMHSLSKSMLHAYCSGLMESGWTGQQELVRLSFLSHLVIGIGIFEAATVVRLASDPSYAARLETLCGQRLPQILTRRLELNTALAHVGTKFFRSFN